MEMISVFVDMIVICGIFYINNLIREVKKIHENRVKEFEENERWKQSALQQIDELKELMEKSASVSKQEIKKPKCLIQGRFEHEEIYKHSRPKNPERSRMA